MSRTLDPSKAHTPQRDYPTMFLFGLIVVATVVGLPMYAYFYDFTWVDWVNVCVIIHDHRPWDYRWISSFDYA